MHRFVAVCRSVSACRGVLWATASWLRSICSIAVTAARSTSARAWPPCHFPDPSWPRPPANPSSRPGCWTTMRMTASGRVWGPGYRWLWAKTATHGGEGAWAFCWRSEEPASSCGGRRLTGCLTIRSRRGAVVGQQPRVSAAVSTLCDCRSTPECRWRLASCSTTRPQPRSFTGRSSDSPPPPTPPCRPRPPEPAPAPAEDGREKNDARSGYKLFV